ncbi:1289_t:CDS:2, partial [Acaulospora colombiana]
MATFYADVAEDFKQLYETKEDYDVKIYAGEELKEELHAHSLKSNISASTFDVILRFIYCGVINLCELDGSEVFKVLIAADELGLQKLIDHIQKFMIENRDNFLREDPVKMLCIVTCHETFDDLKNFCLETILADPDILFGSEKFLNLEESALISILKYDDLAMDEINVWDYAIKWGIAQNPKLKSNIKDFEDQDFEALEKRLRNCIPLIRFHEISMEDFYFRVKPLKKILSEELEDDILRCYMVPNAVPHCNAYSPRLQKHLNSNLVTSKHLILFSSWIDNKTDDYTGLSRIPYKFELLYRSSRDGNDVYTFHNKCDNQGATIVVAKFQDSERLVGGYNPENWDSVSGYRHVDGFIFLINDFKCLKNDCNLGRLNGNYNNNAIYSNSSYGPTFGGGHDIYCGFANNWTSNPYSYTSIGLPSSFTVADWEVFK